MNDWDKTFAPMVYAILNGQNPYLIPEISYVNPPWLFPILLPLAWAPWWLAMLFPVAALVYASWRVKNKWLLLIVGTSFPFFALTIYANVDWVPLLGVVLRGSAGAILVSTKPQSGIFSIVADMSENRSLKAWVRLLLPLVIVVIISTLIFPNWIEGMFRQTDIGPERNATLFPYTIPIGLFALWRCWRKADPLWGVFASLMLSPYFYPHSAVPFMFLLAERNWKLGVAANILSWVYVGLIVAGIINVTL